jgi:non-specific serine/threonine protein kinase
VLSVFAGPFGLDELTAVAGDDRADPVRPLAGLVRQSMVAVVDEDRYQLLDTPRQYGRELLAAWPEVEADAVHERHARAYVAVAASGASGLWSPQQAESLARLRAALPNLRAALDWSFDSGRNELGARIAGSLAWFFMLEGMFAEGRSYLERADRSGNELSRFARTWVAYGLGLLAAPLGELDQARQASQRAVELARESRDVLGMAAGLSALGVTDWALGDLDQAALHQDESVRLYEAAGDPWRKADILVLRARTAADQRDPRARAMLEEAIPLARSVGDLHASGMALAQLSLLAFADRDYATAARSATEALAAHEALNEPEATAGALHLLGRATLACGDVDAARALHRRGLELASAIGHVGAMCEAVEDFAALAAAVGDLRTAAGLLAVAARQRSARGVRLRPLEQDLLDRLWGEVAAAVVDGGAATVAAVGGDLAERRFEGGEFAERPFGAVIAELRGNGRILGR